MDGDIAQQFASSSTPLASGEDEEREPARVRPRVGSTAPSPDVLRRHDAELQRAFLQGSWSTSLGQNADEEVEKDTPVDEFGISLKELEEEPAASAKAAAW